MLLDARELLREHGLQVTAQRLAVIQAVSEQPHATSDEVVEQVRSTIGSVSRQAVYDALGVFSELGILRRIQPAGSAARYEGRVGDNHHHLVCRECGKLVDVDCAVGRQPCMEPTSDHGFSIEEAEVVYWGTCPACQREERP